MFGTLLPQKGSTSGRGGEIKGLATREPHEAALLWPGTSPELQDALVIQKVMSCIRKLLQVALIAVAMVASVVAQAGGGVDRTQEYQDAYDRNCDLGTADIRALRKYRVLLVPGYLVGDQPDYFADQLAWLRSMNVESEKVSIKAGQSIAINGPIVASAIRKSAKPVILITHSKGSIDTLEALRVEVALRTKVRAWISLQGVFFGSPIADMLLDENVISPAVSNLILGFLGGTRESAEGLTMRTAVARYRKFEATNTRIVREVPSVAFVSDIDRTQGARNSTLLEFSYDLMRREGIPNDGLVPVTSAVLPGMDFVKVLGVDHIAPVMPTPRGFDRVRMTRALLTLMIRVPKGSSPHKSGCNNGRYTSQSPSSS